MTTVGVKGLKLAYVKLETVHRVTIRIEEFNVDSKAE